MKSRSPSTSPPLRGRPSAEQSMERLSLRARRRPRRRPRRGRRHATHSPERAASSSVSRDLSLSPPSYASVAGRGLGIPPQPQHEQELALLSDRLPVINIVTASGNQKPGYPTSLPVLPPSMDMNPADVSRDRHSLSPPPLDGSVVGCGVHAPLQPRYQEEQESGSELDSPPRITFRAIQQNQEPRSPTSPPGSPPTVTCPSDSSLSVTGSPTSVDVNLTGSPKHSSSDEEDPYFESLVDNFANAAANSCNSALPYDDIDYKELARRQCVLYAESALKHYNNDEKNEIKYELISAITCSDILAEEGCYGHVNFTAKRNKQDSMEELFFAELRWDGDTPVPTCVVSLEGIKSVGGLCESKYDNFYLDVLPIDTQHCYGCTRELKHPKNGELYEMGHVAMSVYYMGVV